MRSGIKYGKLLLSALSWRHILLYDLCERVISPTAIGLLTSALEKTILKLYVGKLPYQTTDQDLADLFGQYGQVVSATVIIDRETGRSKGFGFVEMSNNQEAQTAQSQLNNSVLGERTIVVNEANDRRDSRSSGYRDRRY